MMTTNHIKIMIRQEHNGDHLVETLWALPVRENFYCLQNIPMEVYLYAYEDIVEAEPGEGWPLVKDVKESSGNSTIRIIFPENIDLPALKEDLIVLGCEIESAENYLMLAISVPKAIRFITVQDYLRDAEDRLGIDYEEACISKHHNNQLSI